MSLQLNQDGRDLLVLLGIDPQRIQEIQSYNTPEDMEIALESFKEDVKAAKKRLAKIHHPDVGGDPEMMKKINAACDAYLSLRVEIKQIPFPMDVRWYSWTSQAADTATSTSTSTGGFYW